MEQVEDVLHHMTENSLTALPVIERDSEEFLGSITSQGVLPLIMPEAKGYH